MARTLNVKKIDRATLEAQWGFALPMSTPNTLYIRCNASGDVNWDKAPVYRQAEIDAREKVNVM